MTTNGYKRYTPRGTTWKPCHGCGQEVCHDLNKVCRKCQDKLDAADALAAREAARTDVEEYAIPNYEYLHLNYAARTNNGSGDPHSFCADAIRRAFVALLQLVDQPVDAAWRAGHQKRYDDVPDNEHILFRSDARPRENLEGNQGRVLLAPEMATTLRALDAAILTTVRTAYADGVQRGSNLLLQLAGGEITAARLSEITANSNKY